MKHYIFIFALTLISWGNQERKVIVLDIKTQSKNETCWIGNLNGKIPIFIHYQVNDNLIIGEITYLNTKNKIPIRLLGTIEEDKNYRLLEFDNIGNITGVIIGKPIEKIFKGNWISPKTKKELVMALSLKDTLIASQDIKPDKSKIFGNYHYQYGERGYNGDFDVNKVGNNKIDFHILSLTNAERGPNIAEVEKDTIAMTDNSFVYKIPDSDNCEFKVTFYNGFVYINYTKGYCDSQFGLGATIDGIYVKTK
jgi:hypothetical protein